MLVDQPAKPTGCSGVCCSVRAVTTTASVPRGGPSEEVASDAAAARQDAPLTLPDLPKLGSDFLSGMCVGQFVTLG